MNILAHVRQWHEDDGLDHEITFNFEKLEPGMKCCFFMGATNKSFVNSSTSSLICKYSWKPTDLSSLIINCKLYTRITNGRHILYVHIVVSKYIYYLYTHAMYINHNNINVKNPLCYTYTSRFCKCRRFPKCRVSNLLFVAVWNYGRMESSKISAFHYFHEWTRRI